MTEAAAAEVTRRRRPPPGLLVGLLFAALPVLLELPTVLTHPTPDHLGWDYAGLEVSVQQVLHGEVPVGPLAQSRFRNLGPAEAVALAPGYALGGGRFTAMLLTGALLALIWSLVLVALSGPRAAGPVGLGLFLWSRHFGVLVDPWNPTTTILPLAVLLVAVSAVSSGRRWAAPVAVAAGGYAALTHPTSLPLVAVAALALGVELVAATRRGGLPRPVIGATVAAAVAVAAVIAAPVIAGRPGNVVDTAWAFVHPDDTPPTDARPPVDSSARIGVDEILMRSSTVLGLAEPDGVDRVSSSGVTGRWLGLDGGWNGVWAVGGLLVVGLLVALLGYRPTRRVASVPAAGLALSAALTTAAGLRSGTLEDYYLLPFAAIGLATLTCGVAALVERWPARPSDAGPAHRRRFAATSVVVILVGLALPGSPTSRRIIDRAAALPPPPFDGVPAELERVTDCRDVAVTLGAGARVGHGWELVTALQRGGFAVHATDRTRAVELGVRLRPTGSPTVEIRADDAPPTPGGTALGPAGSFRVIVHDGTCH